MSPRPVTPQDGSAWITGASSGIGRQLALRLAAEGWTVYATARSAEPLAALAAEGGGRIRPLPADVTDAAGMAAAVAAIEAEGPLALAILNAGVFRPVSMKTFSVELFHESTRVNLDGTVNGLVPAVKAMTPRKRGQVAIVSSVAGYGGLPTSAAYGATKAGLINLAAALKFDLDRLGILIQVVNPGFVETPATAGNAFPMPFLMKVEDAAARIAAGLKRPGFEIAFPRRFALWLKLVNLLPYGLYFAAIRRFTGWT